MATKRNFYIYMDGRWIERIDRKACHYASDVTKATTYTKLQAEKLIKAVGRGQAVKVSDILTDELAARFVAKAREMYHDEGTIEVDTYENDCKDRVSASEPMDGGAYVKAWVWVPLEELKK